MGGGPGSRGSLPSPIPSQPFECGWARGEPDNFFMGGEGQGSTGFLPLALSPLIFRSGHTAILGYTRLPMATRSAVAARRTPRFSWRL